MISLCRSLTAGLGLGLSLLLACSTTEKTPPNVVIVLIDTLRADHTSLYGYERPTTSALERIAADGLVFRSHFSTASWTKPSVATLITGLHPSAHGSRLGQFETLKQIDELRESGKNPTIEILSEEHVTLAERLQAVGYRTAAFVSNYHLTPRFGYDQGYRDYHFDPDRYRWNQIRGEERVQLNDAEIVRSTIDYLGAGEGPAFVWCHLMSVHDYISPDDFPDKAFRPTSSTPIDPNSHQYNRVKRFKYVEEAIAAYDTSIAYTDSMIGRLYDHIRAEEPNTILIITSDHGEEFMEHGGFEHVRTLYNEQLKVPLVVWGPDLPRGEQFAPTSAIDLVPTLISALGLASDSNLLGISLFDIDSADHHREIFAEMHHRGPFRRFAVLSRGHKAILNERKRNGEQELEFYTNGLDIEVENIAESMDDVRLDLYRDRIEWWRETTAQQFEQIIGKSAPIDMEDADVEGLKALGYIQ